MKLYIAADHGGFELKQKIISNFVPAALQTVEFIDLGAHQFDPEDDYPPLAFNLAERVVMEGGDNLGIFGILICRSGSGMCISANKVDGAYAAMCISIEHARKAREHNDANILVLDADYEHEDPLAIIQTFITTHFAAGRHERRVEQIQRYELRTSGEPLA